MKIVVVGAGSSYTVQLFVELSQDTRNLSVDEVTLVDLNAERLEFIASVGQRVLDAANSPIRLSSSTDLASAAQGADYVLPQIRVGGLAARKRDETLPMEFGMVGNETTGAGGFVCALRTVPAVLQIARTVERASPDAWILNLSNPAGIVTEALLKHASVRAMGFCNIPFNTTEALAKIFGVEPANVQLDSFGLNHLSWARGAFVDGEDRLQPLIDQTTDRKSPLASLLDPLMAIEDFRTLRLIPSYYARFFNFTDRIVTDETTPEATKADRDVQAEERLASIFKTVGYNDEAREILGSKGGANYYVGPLDVIASMVHDRGDVIVADVRNDGAIPDLPPDACAEIPARVGASGPVALPVGPLPLAVRGLVQSVKAYEAMTIEAALSGDRGVAIQALVANPLVGTYSRAKPFFERVLQNERQYLPSFFEDGAGAPQPREEAVTR